MFEVVEPILEGDEVFDSSLLKQMVDSMIAAGKRNICVDLAGQDYLYSDAINALVGINKRMLDVMGRLSLVAPQPPVVEILKKGGIANILKIFENDDELMRVSQQLMGGAPPVASFPAPPPVQQEPQSEFDELRSEIGSAFGSIAPAAPQRREAASPPSPFADAGFRQGPKPLFPSAPPVPAQPQFAPPPPVAGPRYAPPPPPLRTFEPAAQKPPAARPVVPPPPPVTKLPAAPIVSGGETRRIPAVSVSEIPTPPPVRPQPEPQLEPEPVFAPQPEEDLNKFEATLEKKPRVPDVPKRDRFDEDLQIAKKKPSFVPVLIALVVLIGLGAGGYFAYTTYSKKSVSGTAITPPAPETEIPQVPVPAPEPSVATPTNTQPVTPPVVKAPEKTPVAPAVSPAAEKITAAAKEAAALKVAAAREAAAEKAAAAKEAAALKAAAAKEAAAKIAAGRESAIRAGAKAAAAREAAAAKAAAAKAAEPPPVNRPSTIEVFDEPSPTPAPNPAIAPRPAPEPEPAPTASPDVSTSGSGEAATVFLASIPPLADVYMDGKLIGKSNSIITVATGTHTLRFVKGEKEITKQFTFTPGKNSPSFVKLP